MYSLAPAREQRGAANRDNVASFLFCFFFPRLGNFSPPKTERERESFIADGVRGRYFRGSGGVLIKSWTNIGSFNVNGSGWCVFFCVCRRMDGEEGGSELAAAAAGRLMTRVMGRGEMPRARRFMEEMERVRYNCSSAAEFLRYRRTA